MKNISNKFNINAATYILILTFLFTGLIKNIILIYLIVLFHELGHIFIIKILKYKIERVDIYPMGGVTTIDKRINTSINHELLISSFGLFFQIILYFIFKFFYTFQFIETNTYELFLAYNKTIFLFNMLPIIPLDGYIFFKSIWEKILPYKKAFYISFVVSIVFMIMFITYNKIFSLNNYLIISFLIYKMMMEYKNFKYIYWKFQLERHIFDINYKKIKYEKKLNLDLLKRDTYHYFRKNEKVYSEKSLLAKKFDKKIDSVYNRI